MLLPRFLRRTTEFSVTSDLLMKILNKIILSIPLLTIFSGCPYIDAAVFNAMRDKREEHECGCTNRDPDDERHIKLKRCDSNGGNTNDNYICCSECNKVCGKFPGAEVKAKPPVPIPLPDCDKKNHCAVKEACKIGDGACCSKCHQACPPWSSEDE